MGDSVGQIDLDLVLNQKQFNKQLSGINKLAASAGKKLVAAFTTKAAITFGKQCLELGSDLNEVQNVVDTVFSNMQAKINKFAKEAAGSYGLSETMAKKYAGTFGAMADSFGFTEQKSYEMSTALTGLAGDLASFYNISQAEAYTKLKSVFTGETESLKELGVVMTQTALDQYALANGFGKTTSAMTEAEKVSLRYAFVQNQLNNAAGDFAKTSDSWANQVRILTLQFESFKAAIGQGLINILTPVIKMINTLMSKLVSAANAFKEFTAAITGKKVDASQITSSSVGLDSVASGADSATSSINGTSKAAKNLQRQLAGFDQINKLSNESSSDSPSESGTSTPYGATSGSVSDAGTSAEIEKVSKSYGKLQKSIEKLQKSASKFWKICKSAGKWVLDNVLKPLGKWTLDEYVPAGLEMWAAAFDLLSEVCKALQPVWQWLWDNLFSKIAKFVGNAIIKFLENMTAGLKKATENVKVFSVKFTELKEALFAKIEELKGKFDSFVEKIANIPQQISSIKEDVKKKWDEIKNCITGKTAVFKASIATKAEDIKAKWEILKKNASDKTAKFKAEIGTTWSDLKSKWTKLKNNASGKTAEFKAKVATTWSDLKSKWTKLKNNASGKTAKFTATVSTTKKAIKDAWSTLSSQWKNKTAEFSLKFSAAASDLKKWVNTNIIDKINSKFSKVPILKNHQIPHLAQGGYVKKNTPQLAMIGDNRHYGEIVAPENKLREMAQMAAAGSGGTSPEVIELLKEILELLKTLDLNVVINGESLTNIIVRIINQKTKSMGRCPIKI